MTSEETEPVLLFQTLSFTKPGPKQPRPSLPFVNFKTFVGLLQTTRKGVADFVRKLWTSKALKRWSARGKSHRYRYRYRYRKTACYALWLRLGLIVHTPNCGLRWTLNKIDAVVIVSPKKEEPKEPYFIPKCPVVFIN